MKIVTFALIGLFMWWLGSYVVDSYHAGNPGFVDVYLYVLAKVSGS